MENYKSDNFYKILNEAKDICTTYPDKSYEMCRNVYDISSKNKFKQEEGYALIGMSLACRAKSEINKMMEYSFNALEIFEELQMNYGQVKSLNIIGIAYFYNSMYEEALKYLFQALDLLDEIQDDLLLSSILNNIGEVFRESGKYDSALEYYNRALKLCNVKNSEINKASLLNNIGEVYFSENKYCQAFEYYTQSYNILIKDKEMVILGEVENKLGKVNHINKNYRKASEHYFRALKILESIDNRFYAIDVLINISKLIMEDNSDEAIYYLGKAMQYAEKTNAKKKLSEICKILIDYYERGGDFKNALEYFKRYHSIEQEIAASIIGNKLEILRIELDHLKENHEFEKVKMVNKRLEVEILNQRNELARIQKLNKVLEKKALEDELTGVPNRSYIKYQMNNTWEEALICDQTVALFIIDIDNFKKYNDYWGHLEGDECLKKVANCLKDIQVRQGAIFARYGGEEFIYSAKGINYKQALELGNLIRNEVEKLGLKYSVDANSSVLTISVGGVLGKPSNLNSISNMIQLADNELYKAKNMGRNITFLNCLLK